MTPEVRAALGEALGARALEVRPVAGGDVNEAYGVTLEGGGRAFVKTRRAVPPGFYEAEAAGLALLRGSGAVRVPEVLALGGEGAPFLALEWIEPGPRGAGFDEAFGRALAAMHACRRPAFGLARSNFIGPLVQPGGERSSWAELYRDLRLAPMIREAWAGLDAEARRDLDRLATRVDELALTEEPASIVHGDLWSGNVMADDGGAPCLVDPAAYAGHREVDLAMLALFGSPSARFFAAYDEALPREPGAEARVPLYQLYFLLVHVALFGSGYLSSVKRALREVL